jgi:acetyl-CoA C-acetyltransferase
MVGRKTQLIDDRLPVIVATGQVAERDEIVSPLELMARAADLAFGEAPKLRKSVQHVSLVKPLSEVGATPASDLAGHLGLDPEVAETTTIGGNTPQWLVTRVADTIWSDDLDVALIVGGEAQRSLKLGSGRASSDGAPKTRPWQLGRSDARDGDGDGDGADPIVGDDRLGFGDAESQAGLFAPIHVYPLFESVIASRAGRSWEEQRRFLGQFLAPLTEIASRHRCAWFPVARTPAEISDLSDENRLVSEPYTKRMCAFLGVDQAAAVVVCSYGAAKSAGLADNAIFCWSGADSQEVWFPTSRPDLGRLPGLLSAGNAALAAAGLGIDEVGLLDFYSCFPCVLEMAHDVLGVALDDPRHSSVTGGLPYFGGPGNSYTMHSIATMAEGLRAMDAGTGLVTGMGWYATKHAVGVYGSSPPPNGWRRGDTAEQQSQIDDSTLPIAFDVDEAGALATVEASTVLYDGSGLVTGAPVIATLDDGRRLAARPADSVALSELAGRNLVGETVHVSGSPIRYRLT